MRIILIFFISSFLFSCGKPKTVLICGDHVCVNKAEAEQYFEENLSIEVQIVKKENKENIDLVELNLSENKNNNRIVSIKQKDNTNKKIKKLSNKEIKKIKTNVKNKNIKKKKEERKSEEKNMLKNNFHQKTMIHQ